MGRGALGARVANEYDFGMFHRARVIFVFLLLGAIVNVAVAWGLAIAGSGVGNLAASSARKAETDFWGYPEAWPHEHDFRYLGFTATELRLPREEKRTDGGWHAAFRIEAGLPLQSLGGVVRGRSQHGQRKPSQHDAILTVPGDTTWLLPYGVNWPRFVANTLFHAALLGLMIFGPLTARATLRRKRRLCVACAYPIGISPVCTECGTAVKHVR